MHKRKITGEVMIFLADWQSQQEHSVIFPITVATEMKLLLLYANSALVNTDHAVSTDSYNSQVRKGVNGKIITICKNYSRI